MIVFNSLIFIHARTSSRRVHVQSLSNDTNENRSHSLGGRNRNIYLVKHMLFNFAVFIIGWSPSYIIALPGLANTYNSLWIHEVTMVLPVVSATIISLDFAYFNHDVRQYLKRKILVCINLN